MSCEVGDTFGFFDRGVWFTVIIHDPANSIFEQNFVEIDEQTDLQIEQSQLRQELGFVARMQSVLTFRLHENQTFNQ